ncbi:MAG: LapA family protein [Nitrosomonas sp.]|uniref:LapA family protein n=1 Tax=Nitrosomonas sp. TaxID=42353 RepID=UPI002566B2CF|nr:LapA family protein [Nitrosomonas sp.]MCC6161123.1 LapA family protein [Nitrosomonas sp.]MDL1867143.1 LapA family protein [Betaproteobacteria bacterium PRO4]
MTLLRLIIFLFLLSVAVKNSEMVTIHYYLGLEWEVPLVVVLLICFAAGTLFGYLSCFIKRIFKKS